MTSSPKLLPLVTSPSQYSNRAREKRCARAKELLVELIKSQTTHDVDPKDVKTTKPSSGVSWRFVVDQGTEFPLVQLSSISRPNLDLLEKAIEAGGVKVLWLNDGEVKREDAENDGDVRRPRKRTRHSTESSLGTDDQSTPTPRASASASTPSPQTDDLQQRTPAFTTINDAIGTALGNMVSLPATNSVTSPSEDIDMIAGRSFINVDIPVSAIADVIEAERNTLLAALKDENKSLRQENEKLKAEFATIKCKYSVVQDQLRTKMHQIQEILEGRSNAKEAE